MSIQYFQNFAHPICKVDDHAISNIKSYPIALYPLEEDYEEVVNSTTCPADIYDVLKFQEDNIGLQIELEKASSLQGYCVASLIPSFKSLYDNNTKVTIGALTVTTFCVLYNGYNLYGLRNKVDKHKNTIAEFEYYNKGKCGIHELYCQKLQALNVIKACSELEGFDDEKIKILTNDDEILKFYQEGYYNASDLEKFDIKVIRVLTDPVMFKCYQNDHYSPSDVLNDVRNNNEMAEHYLSKCQDVADYTFDQ